MEQKVDRRFLLYVLILVFWGLAILSTASAPAGYLKFQDGFYFVKMQIIKGLLPGLVLFLFFCKIDYNFLRKIAWPFYLFVLFLLVLVFVPGLGMYLNGSRSWVAIGPLNFQPSEFGKIALIIILAMFLADRKRDMNNWQYGLLPILAMIAPIFILIVLQPDLGTLSIFGFIAFVMLYLARVPRAHLVVLFLLGIMSFALFAATSDHGKNRLNTFLHPELDPQGVGYQINQAFLAVGSGGFWGLGLGQSRQKYQYLPEVSSDTIFAVLGEEMGFVGAVLLVVLFFLIARRGLKIAKNAPDEFGRLLCGGVIAWFAGQAFLNIGAIVGLLPLTGVPLPFVSHGGSALLSALAAVGIVAGVSKQSDL